MARHLEVPSTQSQELILTCFYASFQVFESSQNYYPHEVVVLRLIQLLVLQGFHMYLPDSIEVFQFLN